MKRILLFLSALFIATTAIAHTINWYVDGNIFHTTTCESGENVTPPTAPEKYGYTFRGWENYIPIEYLESTGTQYIDTGVVLFPISYELKLQIKNIEKNQAFLGTLKNGATTGNDYEYQIGVVKYFYLVNTVPVTSNEMPTTEIYNIVGKIDSHSTVNFIKNNGHNLEISRTAVRDITPINPILIFNRYSANTMQYASDIKLYSAKFWQDDILVRDFIPVLDENGTPCMYDKVERKFYYNAGTGDFIAGPIIGE